MIMSYSPGDKVVAFRDVYSSKSGHKLKAGSTYTVKSVTVYESDILINVQDGESIIENVSSKHFYGFKEKMLFYMDLGNLLMDNGIMSPN